MKIPVLCAIFLVLAATASSEKDESETSLQEEMEGIYSTCREQHKISEEEEKGLEDCNIPESNDGKCFVGCCFQEMTLITNGKFNKSSCEDLATAMYGDDQDKLEKVKGVIDKCEQEVTGNDICDNGPLLMSCIKNHGEGLFLPYPGMKFQ